MDGSAKFDTRISFLFVVLVYYQLFLSLSLSLSPADTIPVDKLNVDLKLGTVKLNRKSGHSSSGCSC